MNINSENGAFTRYEHPEFENDEVNPTANIQSAPASTNEVPWKQLSIGGAFGLLVGGGSIIAASNVKSGEEDALLAGAKAGGEVSIDGQDNDPVVVDEQSGTQESDSSNSNDPQASGSSSTQQDADPQVVEEAQPQVVHHVVHHVVHQEVSSPVNVVDMDDSLSFAEAFAQARAELGPGAAFEWRGGVFGTYYQHEWNSMSHSEQSEFTEMAMNTSLHSHHNYNIAQASVTHHFTEGNVIDLDTGLEYHDEPYYVESHYDNSTVEAGDTADLAYSNNEIEIIDSMADFQEGVQQLVDLNDSVGDFLSDVSNMVDHVAQAGSTTGDIATLIDDAQEIYNDFQSTIESAGSTYDSDMPDYVSDADTVDII